MYFPVGFNPKTLLEDSLHQPNTPNIKIRSLPRAYGVDMASTDAICATSFNPVHSLLCVLTHLHISLWSVQHDGFHLELRHSLYRLNQTSGAGKNVKPSPPTPMTPLNTVGVGKVIVWKPFADYSLLAVRINDSNCCIYRVNHQRMSNEMKDDYGISRKYSEQEQQEYYNDGGEYNDDMFPKSNTSNMLYSTITIENVTEQFINVSTYGNVTCMCADQKNILIGTSIGYILIVMWTGEVLQAITPDFILHKNRNRSQQQQQQQQQQGLKFSPREEVIENSVVSIEFKKQMNMYGVVFRDGTFAFMTQRKNTTNQPSSFLSFDVVYVDHDRGAVSLDLNAKQSIAAIGCKDGQVILFQINSVHHSGDQPSNHENSTQSLRYEFSVRTVISFEKTRGFTEKDLGSAQCVHFTSDGHALCIGYSRRGLALFHPSGTCIMSTLPMYSDVYENKRRLSSDGSVPTPDLSEPFSMGVKTITWDSEGYHLVITANMPTFPAIDMPHFSSHSFYTYSFYKSILCKNSSQNLSYIPGVILQGADRVMLFHMSSDTDFVHADWDQLQLPYDYLAENYPLRFVSISSNGQQLAVAGKSGCALYNRMLRRWRMFGNLHQERATKCTGIVWIDNVVLAIVKKSSGSKLGTEVVLYPRYHLDESSVLASMFVSRSRVVHVSSTTVYITVYNGKSGQVKRQVPLLFLYDTTHHLHVLIAHLTYKGKDLKAQLSRLITVDLSRKHTSVPLSMTTVQCNPPPLDTNVDETRQILSSAKVMFLHTDRTLTALVLQNLTSPDKRKEIVLDSNVDCFWIESEKSYENRCTYFTYHGSDNRGIKLSVQDLSALGTEVEDDNSKIVVHNLIPYDPDACPLGIFKDAGIFLHASDAAMKTIKPFAHEQHQLLPSLLSYPYYELQPKMYPYGHGILLSLLLGNQDPYSQSLQNKLAKFASKLSLAKSNKPTFVATLEWMFHSVLSVDDTVSTVKATDDSTLYPKKFCIMHMNTNSRDNSEQPQGTLIPLQQGLAPVVKFLRALPHLFYEVVVNCLRKTDIALWQRLFDIMQESPRDMFQNCMDQGFISEAVNMLRILQQTEDLDYVKECSYALLRPALSCSYFDRASDLIRFIQMIETEQKLIREEEREKNEPDNSEQDVKDEQGNDELYGPVIHGWLSDNARLQGIITRQCRDLLIDANLFALLRLIESLDLPLVEWLKSEKDKAGTLEVTDSADWEDTFSRIHEVFDLPRSTFKMDSLRPKQLQLQDQYKSEFFSFTQYRIFMIPELVSHLEFLFQSFDASGCTGHALLLATLLCRVESIEQILSHDDTNLLWKCYSTMLKQENNWPGYSKLLHHLKMKYDSKKIQETETSVDTADL